MPFGAGTHDIGEQRHPAPVSPHLVFGHEDRVAGDIDERDRRKVSGTAVINGRSSRYRGYSGHYSSASTG